MSSVATTLVATVLSNLQIEMWFWLCTSPWALNDFESDFAKHVLRNTARKGHYIDTSI